MGVSPIYPSFLSKLREVTQRTGVLLLFDEVVTGFRTSPGGAQARYGVTPDVTALAKILGGGLNGGAVAGKAEIVDMVQHRGTEWDATHRIQHQGTFNGNPLSAVAGFTTLELVATTDINARAEAAAQQLKAGINQVLARLEIPGCANGVASLMHITLGVPHECDGGICKLSHKQIHSMPAETIRSLKRALINAGVDPMGGRTLIVSGTHQVQEVDFTIAAYEEALTAMRDEGIV